MKDIVIVGGGTAGFSAAIYAARAGKSTLVLEGRQPGGQIVNSPEVENYPGIQKVSGFEFISGLKNQVLHAGADVLGAEALSIQKSKSGWEVHCKEQIFQTKAVILACGAVNRKLGLEREERLTGRGVSYCAVCDGAFFKGKDVAVVGGGNTALEDALFLVEKCHHVYVIHRREQFRAESRLVNRLAGKGNVTFLMETVVTALCGEEHLQALHIKNTATHVSSELIVNGVFAAIGQAPQTDWLAGFVLADQDGYIVADESCYTNQDGIYVAGDCRTKKVRQLVTAASDGAVAALAACEFIG